MSEFGKFELGKYQKQNCDSPTRQVWQNLAKFGIHASGELGKFGPILVSFANTVSLASLSRYIISFVFCT